MSHLDWITLDPENSLQMTSQSSPQLAEKRSTRVAKFNPELISWRKAIMLH